MLLPAPPLRTSVAVCVDCLRGIRVADRSPSARTDSEAKERSKAKKAGSKVEAGKKTAVKGGAAPRAQKKTGNRGAL